MNTSKKWANAGLVFVDGCDLDIVEAANLVVSGFETLGQRVASVHIHSDTSALVTTDTHRLELSIDEDVLTHGLTAPAAVVLNVRIAQSDQPSTKRFAGDSLLARALQGLNDQLCPDFVKWIDSDVLLPSAAFASATGGAVRAKHDRAAAGKARRSSAISLPDVDETNEILQRRISNHDPVIVDGQSEPEHLRKIFSENWVDPHTQAAREMNAMKAREEEDIEKEAPLRLSAWMISFAVTLFALPLGVALMVLNLMKGENLRLASQTAALTGTFLSLQASGASAHALVALQHMIG